MHNKIYKVNLDEHMSLSSITFDFESGVPRSALKTKYVSILLSFSRHEFSIRVEFFNPKDKLLAVETKNEGDTVKMMISC